MLAGGQVAAQEVHRSAYHDFRVVTVAEGLDVPWSVAWLPDGDMLVTERPGRLRVVRDGTLLPDPVPGVPEVLARGQGCLFEVLPHPDFATNRLLYLSYARPKGEGSTTAASRPVRGRSSCEHRGRLRGAVGGPAVTTAGGWPGAATDICSSRWAIGWRERRVTSRRTPRRTCRTTTGSRCASTTTAASPRAIHSLGRTGALPEIWSYGHRNPQGLFVHPETGEVWAHEHGPQGGDELNRIRPGLNYGWPVVGYGVNYGSGTAIHAGTRSRGRRIAVHFWVPSIATSGLLLYRGDRFPEWKGSFFVGGMAGRRLARLTPSIDRPGRIEQEETLAYGIGRVRDVRQGPDGYIYLAVEQRGRSGRVVRLEPVERRGQVGAPGSAALQGR